MRQKIRAALRRVVAWWWQGMRLHARQVCRDEVEILEQIRSQAWSRAEGRRR